MALQLFSDGILTYDSRMEEYALEGLKTTTGLNKGGTAEIIMPAGHPGYNAYISYRSIVTLYENGKLQFRGRPLYPSDDVYNTRTIMCEGERCFLRDGIIRPYLYQDSPAAIFAAALALYNAEVDDFKQFTLGVITVTDSNNYVRLESDAAETFADFFDKLVERCGGYITFTDDGNGGRAINWLAEITTTCRQSIEFGENLLDFARSGESAELATAIVPYGAQLEDGTRVTISSVTEDGADWIQDDEAVALRGRITATVTWDDVTEPANLLTKARAWLSEHRMAVTALQLSAVDLSVLDRSLDSFTVGSWVQVKSGPHGVNSEFQVTDRERNWLADNDGQVTMGKTFSTLTGVDAAVQRAALNYGTVVLQQANTNAATLITKSETEMSSKIDALADSITLEVSGGLGNTAAIRLNVNGAAYTESLELSNVRRAFADDASAITIQAGVVTFDAGTFAVNSKYFQVTTEGKVTATSGSIGAINLSETGIYSYTSGYGTYAGWYRPSTINDSTICFFAGATSLAGASAEFSVTYGGKLTATGAEINGTLTTESSKYKAQLHSGGLGLYWEDALCGIINTKYWSGASAEGISLRVEQGGSYIMFSHYDETQGSGYRVDYYLNRGWSSNYDELHIFQTSARFLDDVYLAGYTRVRSLRLFGADGEYLVGINSNGQLTVSKL